MCEKMYKLSNIDMSNLYDEMLCYDYEWPQVIVVDELPDNRAIERWKSKNGNDLVQIKNSKDMVQRLFLEMQVPSVARGEIKDFMKTNMNSQERMEWIFVAVCISGMLRIRCPQILFCECLNGNAGIFSGEGLLTLPDLNPENEYAKIEMLVNMAHEFRHKWQSVNHPEWMENYISGEEDSEEYLLQDCEIDAETYARKLAGEVFDINLFKHPNKKIEEALTRHKDEADLCYDEKYMEWLQGLFEE